MFLTSTQSFVVPSDVYQIRAYAFGAGANGTTTASGGGGGCAFGTIATTPNETLSVSIASGIAKLSRGATALITGNPASGTTGGTASKDASVTGGGAFSGGNGLASAGAGGASSGSPKGVGYSGGTSGGGGAGWGGDGGSSGGSGGGVASSGGASTISGRGFTAQEKLALTDPLLAICDGSHEKANYPFNVNSTTKEAAGCGGFGDGSVSGRSPSSGGFGGGGGGGVSSFGYLAGHGGFGGGGGGCSVSGGTGGNGGFGGGGGSGMGVGGAGGGACVVIFY